MYKARLNYWHESGVSYDVDMVFLSFADFDRYYQAEVTIVPCTYTVEVVWFLPVDCDIVERSE